MIKSTIVACLAALLTTAAHAGSDEQDEYYTFIRQQQQVTGTIWDMPVELVGESLSPMNIEAGGSLFQLWAIHTSEATDYLLDQKLVGAYLPAATLSITTGDPTLASGGIPRTRADQPFYLHTNVSGLLSPGDEIPDAATKVLLEHYAKDYPETFSLSRTEVLADGPIDSGYITENGTQTITFPTTSLTGADPTKVSGEEHFLIHALADEDNDYSQTELASAMIQIWPVADGSISGITDNQTIDLQVPDLTVTLNDLYPNSTTYLQIYPGAPSLGTTGTKLPGSVLVLDQDKSESRVLTVENWGSVVTDDTQHTIELITVTPFGTERLATVTFGANRVLKVRAMITNME
ncbi:MAG: hypothetical protein Q7R22_003475 [Verrucomicrobiota bacterium JB025]|nr:hypothetical protein [Verrucomicrobiota bacterium JB025]